MKPSVSFYTCTPHYFQNVVGLSEFIICALDTTPCIFSKTVFDFFFGVFYLLLYGCSLPITLSSQICKPANKHRFCCSDSAGYIHCALLQMVGKEGDSKGKCVGFKNDSSTAAAGFWALRIGTAGTHMAAGACSMQHGFCRRRLLGGYSFLSVRTDAAAVQKCV